MRVSTDKSGGWTVDKVQLYGTSDNSVGAIAGSSPSDIWAVGDFLPDTAASNDGSWTVNPAPNPGRGSNILGGVTAIDGQLWAAGVYDNGGSEIPLVEHR